MALASSIRSCTSDMGSAGVELKITRMSCIPLARSDLNIYRKVSREFAKATKGLEDLT